ncbi:MAG: hypothetical protein WDM91_02250 [Rhizomicrobium sp.]
MRWLWVALLCVVLAPVPGRAASSQLYQIRYDHWSADDERSYRDFVQALGEADCRTVDACLHSPANPFRLSDPPGAVFNFDCADFTYLLRFYFAWKRGLPFSYEDGVVPRGASSDFRYSPNGNAVAYRRELTSGTMSGMDILSRMRDEVSSANYRIHPDLETPLLPDHYPVAIARGAIRPGTLIYDPNGHVAVVFRVDPDGRIHYFDSHTDFSLARSIYDLRFTRAVPGAGAGFKNWRPQVLVGATRQADGTLTGGHIELARNAQIDDFSTEQFYGNGARPDDANWASGAFTLNGETIGYYDYVRARLSTDGDLRYDPVKEVHEMVQSNCDDLRYRVQAVDIAIAAGLQHRPEPDRLPANIYGTDGDWEVFSSPSRDARLKTAFKELRDAVERFAVMYVRGGDPHLDYQGDDLVGDMLATYRRDTAACTIRYVRSDGSGVPLSYEDARRRLFAMSFDPYQCVERRWGASDAAELATCSDGAAKRAWYAAEQKLRNQLDRTYEARMDFSLAELTAPGDGRGVDEPPDTDVLAFLNRIREARPGKSAGF